MKNIEKYKDIIIDNTDVCSINRLLLKKNIKGFCSGHSCEGCKDRAIKWLLEECKEPVLADVEKEYLSAVIKPFRKKVVYIKKNKNSSNGMQYLAIEICDDDYMYFPYLDDDEMYKGMEVNKEYSLEELGL